MDDIEKGDPRAIARLMRQMSDETGVPMEPEMEGVLNRLEAGEDPESIEADMDDLGAADTAQLMGSGDLDHLGQTYLTMGGRLSSFLPSTLIHCTQT